VIPIPKTLAPNLRSLFLTAATDSASLVPMPNGLLPLDPSAPYIRIDLPDDDAEPLVLTLPVDADAGVFFNQQFARRVVAEALKVPEKASWKQCVLSVEEETGLTQAMKKMLE
ncbi:hypothetical protein HDU98_002959, partial [Podochytrium sp. JEL0797]